LPCFKGLQTKAACQRDVCAKINFNVHIKEFFIEILGVFKNELTKKRTQESSLW
jgi:hypothetical protein